jgi:vitamin B12 transporter
MHSFILVPLRAPLGLRLSLLSAALLSASGVSHAQSDGQLPTVMVTATRTEQPLTDVVSDVSVIDRELIERSGASSLADVLSRLPGVELTRAGGPAATTSLYVRGAETRHTLLMIDGVRVDSQSTGGPAWQALPLDQIDRIEVLRGPAAAIYGSDAMGGVVQIFTRQGTGPAQPSVAVGVGSQGTRKLDASLSGAQGVVDYALALGSERSTGFNAQPAANPDKDGYRRTSGSARLGYRLGRDHKLEATWLGTQGDARYDAFNSKKDDHALQDLSALGLNWTARWSGTYRTRVTLTEGRDRYETTPSAYLTDTRLNTYLWHNEWKLGTNTLTAALERREDRLTNATTTPTHTRRHQDALALGYGLKQGPHTLQMNLRRDNDSEFGGHTTGSAAYAFALTPQWRLTASAGTAFRAPTLYQRFSIYGLPTLKPENATNLELGAKYAAGADTVSVVAYRNRVTNLITYVSGPGTCVNGVGTFAGCYGNTDKAQYTGVTLAGGTRLARVGLNASLDLQNPTDEVTGKLLARRAKRIAKLGAETTVQGWNLAADWLLAGERFNNAANNQRLGGYALVNLAASKDLSPGWSVLARVDNLANKAYQTTTGYAMAGRTLYVGLKWAAR